MHGLPVARASFSFGCFLVVWTTHIARHRTTVRHQMFVQGCVSIINTPLNLKGLQELTGRGVDQVVAHVPDTIDQADPPTSQWRKDRLKV